MSVSRGLPSWQALVQRLWSNLEPTHTLPSWLNSDAALPHPLAYQILLEEIEGATQWEIAQQQEISVDDVDPRQVQQTMVDKISRELYANAPSEQANDTLGVLIELLRQEQKSSNCRIVRVISFNADDLLERGTNRDPNSGKEPVVFPVPRGSFHPRHGKCAFDRAPINIFHLHGFIPWSDRYKRTAQDTLVFTDAQYWESVSNPSSFANRVMSNALQDSRCVFIGMSMTDVNMMRWLGLRYAEFVADRNSYYSLFNDEPAFAAKKIREALSRHYWICTKNDDPSRLIASHLERRGITTVRISSWGQQFKELIDECFASADPVDTHEDK